MKAAEYIANWIATINPRVYAVCGAGAMHLNDAFCHHPDLQVMAMHHEQAAAFAAEADARVSGKPGIVHVTAGPGGSNAITGVAAAWVDSIPMIVVSGQITTSTLRTPGLRQLGMNELDIIGMVAPITKYAICVRDIRTLPTVLDAALYHATHGRPGPVWIDVPLDIQSAEVETESVFKIAPDVARAFNEVELLKKAKTCAEIMKTAQRPVLLLGNGARGADVDKLLSRLAMPVVTSWGASDILSNKQYCYLGRCGIFGDYASNQAIQNCDVLLVLGSRLSPAQTGHHPHLFAPQAQKIVVDIDSHELDKPTVKPDFAICADVAQFVSILSSVLPENVGYPTWTNELRTFARNNPVMRPEYGTEKNGVNAYYCLEQMQKHLADDAIVVTDPGVAYIATMQMLRMNGKQRLFHSGGVCAMGYGVPAAIGAYRASGKQTICMTGDGSMMMNMQELQTIAQHKLPIKMFLFANNGYATIRIMQDTHFKRHSISSPETGLTCPDFILLAKAFGIPTFEMFRNAELERCMGDILSKPYPVLTVVHLTPDQKIAPRVVSRIEDGKFVPSSLSDMQPALA